MVVSSLSLIQDEETSGIEKSGGKSGGGGMALAEEVSYSRDSHIGCSGSGSSWEFEIDGVGRR